MFPVILLYVVLTIIRPQDYVPGLIGVPLLSGVLIFAFLCWLGASEKTYAAPQFTLLPAFLLVLMISQVVNGWAGGSLHELSTFGPVVISFFIFAASSSTQRRLKISMGVIAFCAMVLALHGVLEARSGIGWTGTPLSEDGRIRYVGIFDDPNDLGLLLVSAFPMAVFVSQFGGLLGRLFWLAGALLLLYGIYLTNSRGAMLAVLAVGGVYVAYRRGLVTAGILGAIGLICMQALSSRMTEINPEEESAAGRVDAWYEGFQMFKSHPLLGVGPGNFTDYNPLTAHNSFVLVMAETGFIGLLLWLAVVGYSFQMVLTVLRFKPEPLDDAELAQRFQSEKAIALTLLLTLCGLFTAAFFLSRSYIIVLYLFIAMVVGHYVGARQRFPQLPAFNIGDLGSRWVPITIGSTVAMFLLVMVLLRTQ